jgi:hypothetical protein
LAIVAFWQHAYHPSAQLMPQPLTEPTPPTLIVPLVSHDDAPSPPLSHGTIAGAELIAGSAHAT